MNQFPENKFKELSLQRKLNVMLDLIYKIEEAWPQSEQRLKLIEIFHQYFQWSDFYECDEAILKNMAHLEFKITPDMSLRSLLDIAVPIERYLNIAIKDDHLFRVKQGDQTEGQREVLPVYYILDHLRSAFNVGSLFRTAECLGVQHIYLVGYTPTPEDNGVQKTAMGTENQVPWSVHNHLEEVREILKRESVEIVALETAESAKPLHQFRFPEKVALLVGNERFGLADKEMSLSDHCVEIPMLGKKNSLNVANTLSIVTYEVVRQCKK